MTVLQDKIINVLSDGTPLSTGAISVIVREYIKPERASRIVCNNKYLQGSPIETGYAKVVSWTLGELKSKKVVELIYENNKPLWRIPSRILVPHDWTCPNCYRKFTTYEDQSEQVETRYCPYRRRLHRG
ncbi:MAG: hypothetical protein MUO97_05865 [Dehalococcoidia bacterium]|nr:hypothetical protein [Dehalococcoidia bacterium]